MKANGANGPSAYSSPVKIFIRATRLGPDLEITDEQCPAHYHHAAVGLEQLHGSERRAGVRQVSGADRQRQRLEHYVSTLDVPGISNSQVVAPTLLNGTTYYWRVRSWNVGVDGVGENADDDFSGWSSVRSLRIAYAAPVLTLPLDAAIGVALKPTFTWDAIPGATTYNLQVSNRARLQA